MMRPYIEFSEADRKTYNARKLAVGLISPFGILLLIFLVYSLAADTSEQQSLAQSQMSQGSQAQRVIDDR